MSSLLSRAGFSIPTVDTDELEVEYPSMFELIADLRDMGESNAVINRRGTLRRDTLIAASAIYQGECNPSWSLYRWNADIPRTALHGTENGTVPATFATIYCVSRSYSTASCACVLIPRYPQIGWKPAPTQAKPLKRGSASHSMKDALAAEEAAAREAGAEAEGGKKKE